MNSRNRWIMIFLGMTLGTSACAQVLGYYDEEYRLVEGGGGTAGNGGSGGMGGVMGMGGAGGMAGTGGSPCVPESDNNECTDDVCNGDGMTVHIFKAAGAPCTMNGSQCDGNGQCVVCLAPIDCPGTDDACQTRTCVTGACGIDFQPDGMEIPTQNAGDCMKTVCDGAGMTKDVNDDNDIPDDSNACTSDTCNAGTPSNTNVQQGTNCGTNGNGDPLVCNDMGQCLGCNVAADCGVNDECKTFTCTNNVCAANFAPKDTPVAAQTANDCLRHVCDGNGNMVDIADDTDLPLEDGNVCTGETCSMGMPNHPNVANGSMCSDSDACTLLDTCQMGTCTPGAPKTCTALDQCHLAGTCFPMNGSCSNPNAPDGTACQVNGASGTCTTGICKKINGQTCAAGTECVSNSCVDGVCCNSACNTTCKSCNVVGSVGTCNNTPAGSTDTVPTNLCSGTNQCDGAGVCKKINGQTCAAGTECLSGNCVDGVCCNSACNTTCKSCNVVGSVGTCNNIPAGSTDTVPTNLCSGTNQCDGAGVCKKVNGQTCAAGTECLSGNCVDGICCNSACTTTCQACNVTGNLGACTNLPSGQKDNNPANACNGVKSCNGGSGAGACLKDNGQTCAAASECVSNNCVDGVCCNSACTTTCNACNLTGSLGTCTNLPSGQSDNFPSNTCTGTNACNGSGSCKTIIGGPCMGNSFCLSGFCVDGVCCNSACNTACKSCNIAGSLGTCSNTPAGSTDTVPTNLCSGTNQCDGAGVCKKINGQICAAAGECVSGNCVDGVCCNSACTGTCQACSMGKTGVANGTCSNIMNGSDPDSECLDQGPMSCQQDGVCNGSGACRLYASGTVCVPGSCSNGVQYTADTCNGSGMCLDQGTVTCSPYVCGGNACYTSCSNNAQCGLGYVCSAGQCVAFCGDGLKIGAEECDDGNSSNDDSCTTMCVLQEVAQVVAGGAHTCARLSNGSVKCWGYNDYGQLGLGDTMTRGNGPSQMGSNLPSVNLGVGKTAIALAAGQEHTCAILDDGSVKCWGNGNSGQLGLGSPSYQYTPAGPLNLGVGKTAVALAAGQWHTCAILNDGSVKCWGYGGYGQLGLGNSNTEYSPAGPLNLGVGKTAVALTAGDFHTCAILNDGSVKCWGDGGYGQLGLGNSSTQYTPAGPLDFGVGKTAVALTAGPRHTCAILNDGSVKCWGDGYYGQLGLGSSNNQYTPTGPLDLGFGKTAVALAAGQQHTCAILNDSSVKCWGDGSYGQLGLGSSSSQYTPVGPLDLGLGKTGLSLAARANHTCSRLNNGSLKCWGANYYGQLGLGDTQTRGDQSGEMGDSLPIVTLFTNLW